MGQDVKNDSRFCQIPQSPKKDLNRYLKPRTIFMAVSLTLILTTTGLVYYGMQPPLAIPPPPPPPPTPLQLTPHGAIAIDGDANFSDTALLKGWPGDGSPENPFIIDGLDIDLGGAHWYGISINNTRASFTISNCNVTSADGTMEMCGGAGINLENVTNGELVNNTCNNNFVVGIKLSESDSNTVVNNTCIDDGWYGISLWTSDSNTVANNTCSSNSLGILISGDSNTVANNTCNSNGIGIELGGDSNTVTNNTCSSNTERGIYLHNLYDSTVVDNTCNSNGREGHPWKMGEGIFLRYSNSNTVNNNTCFGNTERGIYLSESDYNTMTDNTCNSNDIGIELYKSDSNTIANNTCNNNRIGIHLDESLSNTGSNNNCLDNTEQDIIGEFETEEFVFDESAHQEFVAREFAWLLAGFGMILLVSVIAFVQFRRMEIH
ncbi:MAG: right-handed parallel beta-helix repeat-containing protein [Candidatus Thorarchaeota archaeon]